MAKILWQSCLKAQFQKVTESSKYNYYYSKNLHLTHPTSGNKKTYCALWKPTSNTYKLRQPENLLCPLKTHIQHIKLQETRKMIVPSENPHLTHTTSGNQKTYCALWNLTYNTFNLREPGSFCALWKPTSNTSNFKGHRTFSGLLFTHI